MINKTHIVKATGFDPWYNLAVEEYLLNIVKEDECFLYLWQNDNTVVIGRNQNPWKECRTTSLEANGGKLARRLSGGGAVFHDLGNLNFTFIMGKAHYDLGRQVKVILSAAKRLGVPAEMTGRNDLTVDGRKFSGNAFCFKKSSAYHHGTILISSNMENLVTYLQVSDDKIKSKGIESVRSRVVNLTEINPNITIDGFMEVFAEEFENEYGLCISNITTSTLDQSQINELYNKYSSWDWRYGEAPKFDITMTNRFVWGGVDINFQMENGIIKDAIIYSDAMDTEYVQELPRVFIGATLNGKILADCVFSFNVDSSKEQMKNDLVRWLSEKQI